MKHYLMWFSVINNIKVIPYKKPMYTEAISNEAIGKKNTHHEFFLFISNIISYKKDGS